MTEDAGRLVGALLRAELQRLVAMAQRVASGIDDDGLAARVRGVDSEIDVLLGGLERRGVAYPGHAVGARYGLAGPEYALLIVSLGPLAAQDVTGELKRLLSGDPNGPPGDPSSGAVAERALRLSQAARLLGASSGRQLRDALEGSTLLREHLIGLEPPGADDPALVPSRAVCELFGLAWEPT